MRLPMGGRVPPTDGTSHWRYPVTPQVMIRAKSHQELIDAVFQFRLRNNIPIGDADRDISDYYCAQYPRFCHEEPSDREPSPSNYVAIEPILNRVSRWASVIAHRMPRGGYALVTQAEADSRAAICAVCPKQNAGWRGGCGGCSAATLQILQELKKLKKTTLDGNLGACSIAGWANATAIWEPIEALDITEEQRAAMPAACWRKAL